MIRKKTDREIELQGINDNLKGMHETLEEISANLWDCLSRLEDLVDAVGKFADKFKDTLLDAAFTARQ